MLTEFTLFLEFLQNTKDKGDRLAKIFYSIRYDSLMGVSSTKLKCMMGNRCRGTGRRNGEGRAGKMEDGKVFCGSPCWLLLLTFPSGSIIVWSASSQRTVMVKQGVAWQTRGWQTSSVWGQVSVLDFVWPHSLLQWLNSALVQRESSYS